MKMEKNFKDFDYQTIVVKKEKSEEIIKNYESFGWLLEKNNQHHQYENLLEIEFSRPHKIKNKDALQFLQVNLDSNIIAQGRLEKHKHAKSTILASNLGALGLIFIVNSVLSFLYMKPINALIVGSLFGLLGLTSLILIPILLKKILTKEKLVFDKKNKEFHALISEICKKAKELTGDKDGKN